MDREVALAIVRQAYAKQILAEAGVTDRRIGIAFAQVRRGESHGRGPWSGRLRWPSRRGDPGLIAIKFGPGDWRYSPAMARVVVPRLLVLAAAIARAVAAALDVASRPPAAAC